MTHSAIGVLLRSEVHQGKPRGTLLNLVHSLSIGSSSPTNRVRIASLPGGQRDQRAYRKGGKGKGQGERERGGGNNKKARERTLWF